MSTVIRSSVFLGGAEFNGMCDEPSWVRLFHSVRNGVWF